jgi:ABC-type multidrug transport system fused ATPase/permease subunit
MTFRREIEIITFFICKRKKVLLLLIGVMFLCAILEALSVAAFFPLFTLLQGVEGPEEATFFRNITNFVIGLLPIENKLVSMSIIVFIVFSASQLISYINEVLSSWWRYRLTRETQNELFRKYMHSPYSLFLNRKHGELLYNCYNVPGNACQVWLILPTFFVAVLKTLTVSAVLLSLQYQFSLALFAMGIIFFYLIRYIAKSRSIVYGEARLVAHRAQAELISEAVSGIRQLKAFFLEKLWINKFAKAVNDFVTVAQKDAIITALPRRLVETCGIGLICLLVIGMTYMYDEDKRLIILPTIGVFAVAIQRILPAVSQLGNLRLQFVGILPNLELLYNELNLKIEEEDRGDIPFTDFNKGIRLQNVEFAYNNHESLFKGINLCFNKSKITAIVGSSGAGKTTLIDIIMRLYSINAGEILVDNTDFYSIRREDWLGRIGFVSQDTFIFNASIRENIKVGKEGASDEEMTMSATLAFADEFIEKMPDGYDTIVGDRGLKLSGGQRQRIAIARALIRDPEIIIFDEATSALDNVSEQKIKEAIKQLGRTKTIIISAHRLTTVQDADNIYVLDHGEVVEEGTHHELFSKEGYYWSLYRMQKKGEIAV